VGPLPRYLEIACIDPHQTGFVGKGSDHLQLIKFWRPAPLGRGSAAGRNFLAPPYYSQRAVFASPLSAFYRQDAPKRQTACIKCTHRPNIRFFALQGRLVAQIHVKLGTADRHRGPLGCAKSHLKRHRGGNVAPKYQKFPLFSKESASRGEPIDRFRASIRLTILH